VVSGVASRATSFFSSFSQNNRERELSVANENQTK
jgi:hypothetical protein